MAGLPLSGGGIRSASYCLGALQGLANERCRPQIDYLQRPWKSRQPPRSMEVFHANEAPRAWEAHPRASRGIALVDEFENDLHPRMLEPILDLFASPKTNPKNAQIVFTCHSAEVLHLLNKAQIMLVEKTDCESHAWRLDTMQGVRSDDNFFAKYMSGAYGATPQV